MAEAGTVGGTLKSAITLVAPMVMLLSLMSFTSFKMLCGFLCDFIPIKNLL
jgi:hypothetical protein